MADQVALDNQGTTTINDAPIVFNQSTNTNGSTGRMEALSTAIIEFHDTTVRGGTLSADPIAQVRSTGSSGLANVTVSGSFSNSGSLALCDGDIPISGIHRQTAGTTFLQGSPLQAGLVDIQAKALRGNGTTVGDAQIAGTVDSGSSAGI